jgi:hypothetical protein
MVDKVFISYRRDDSRYQARMIYTAFTQWVPRENVFMDIDSIPIGSNFRKILKGWVDQCDVLLALIGPGWINAVDPTIGQPRLQSSADFVRIEISEALSRDIPVVPVLLDGTPMPDVDLLPDDLKELVDRQAEFVEYRTFDADVERLIKKLQLAVRQQSPDGPVAKGDLKTASGKRGAVAATLQALPVGTPTEELLSAIKYTLANLPEPYVKYRELNPTSARLIYWNNWMTKNGYSHHPLVARR